MHKKVIATKPGEPRKIIALTAEEETELLQRETKELLQMAKRMKKGQIKSSAEAALKTAIKGITLGELKVIALLWPGIDQTKLKPAVFKAMQIRLLMQQAVRAVKAATTIAEVDAVAIPTWP